MTHRHEIDTIRGKTRTKNNKRTRKRRFSVAIATFLVRKRDSPLGSAVRRGSPFVARHGLDPSVVSTPLPARRASRGRSFEPGEARSSVTARIGPLRLRGSAFKDVSRVIFHLRLLESLHYFDRCLRESRERRGQEQSDPVYESIFDCEKKKIVVVSSLSLRFLQPSGIRESRDPFFLGGVKP